MVMEKYWKNIGGMVKGINKDVKDVMFNVFKLLFGLSIIGGVVGLVSLFFLMFVGFLKLMSLFGVDCVMNF